MCPAGSICSAWPAPKQTMSDQTNQREKINELYLKLAGIITVFSFIYPAILTVRIYFFSRSGGVFSFLYALFTLSLGFAAGILLFRKAGKYYRKLAAFCGVVIPLLGLVLFISGRNQLQLILEIPALVLLYFVGMYGYCNGYVLSSNYPTITGTFVLALCLLARSVAHIKVELLPYVCVFFLLCVILVSQRNINRIFLYQNTSLSVMIRGLRRFNVLIALLLLFIILIALNLRKIVAFFLTEVKNIVLNVLLWLWRLVSSLFPGAQKGPSATQADQPQVPLVEPAKNNPLLDWIVVIVVCLVTLYALYRITPFLWEKIKQLASIILNWIRKLLKAEVHDPLNENAEYFDEVEQISRQQERKRHTHSRSLRRNLKLYGKIADPVQKVRYLYALVLETLSRKTGRITPSDTPHEILGKSAEYPAVVPNLADMTHTYEKVRYHDTIPDGEAVREAESACRQVLEKLQGNH